jgi:hypothetical protein
MREMFTSRKTLVIVAALAIVVIGALLIYGIIVTPARQPYRDALTQYQNVNLTLARTNVSINASTASDEEFDQNISAVRTAFVSLNTENEALAQQSVLGDGEGKSLYDAYDAKLRAYTAYNVDLIASIEKIRPVFFTCSKAMGSVSENADGARVMRTCATDMKAASDVPDVDYSELATNFYTNYDALATIFDQMGALADPSGTDKARNSELSKERDQVIDRFSTASDTFSANVQEHRNQVLTTDSAKKLQDYLTAKSRIFS